jgi:hypothetical protein
MTISHYTQPQNKTYKYFCEKCNYLTNNCKNWERHLNTKKHNKTMYNCELCNYSCKTNKHYNQHLQTKKHCKNMLFVDSNVNKNTNIIQNNTQGNTMPDYVTKILYDYSEQTNKLYKVIEEQNETKKQLLEMVKTPKTIIYNNNEKTINNTFKLNNFLLQDWNDI